MISRGSLDHPVRRIGPVTVSRADALLSGAMLVLAVADATYLHWLDGRAVGWRVAGAVVLALALLARSSLPVVSLAGVQLALPFWDMPGSTGWSMTQIVAFLVSSYAIGAHLPWRHAAVAHGGLVIVYVVVAWISVGDPLDGVGSVGIATFAWALGLVVHQRGLERDQLAETARLLAAERDLRARAAVAEERTRIARELHDSLGHEVSVMVLHAGAVRRLLTEDQTEQREALERVERLGRDAVAQLHRLVATLREDDAAAAAPHAPSPGVALLPDVVSRLRLGGATIRLEIDDLPPLPADVDAAVYRVVQESLTNAVRHAPGSPVQVRIRSEAAGVAVEVTDDGARQAAPATPATGGWGLPGMRERVHLLGGRLVVGPRAGAAGWQVLASLPVRG